MQTYVAIVVLTAPLTWMLLGGAIFRERRNGQLAPQWLRLVGYDLFAVALGALALFYLASPSETTLSLSWPMAIALGLTSGLLAYAAYARGRLRGLLSGVARQPLRFAEQGTLISLTSAAEEIAWRGVALGVAVWVWGWPMWLALVITSMLFGTLHLGLGGIRLALTHSVTGAMLALLYLMSRRAPIPLFGEGNGVTHLRLNAPYPLCGGFDQPPLSAHTDLKERDLEQVRRLWGPLRALTPGRVVGINDACFAPANNKMTGNLGSSVKLWGP